MLHAIVLAALLTQDEIAKNPLVVEAQAAANACVAEATKPEAEQSMPDVIKYCSASAAKLEALFPLKGSVAEGYVDLWYYDAALSRTLAGAAYRTEPGQAAAADAQFTIATIECEFIIHDPDGLAKFKSWAGKMEDELDALSESPKS
jgi:hypothetical protein